ncbi:MAG: hypothetical protein HQL39_15435 [Alphaproteobacteria bacterium]|nr:hypothetical protein [Alphaproteobacteria bacterium]
MTDTANPAPHLYVTTMREALADPARAAEAQTTLDVMKIMDHIVAARGVHAVLSGLLTAYCYIGATEGQRDLLITHMGLAIADLRKTDSAIMKQAREVRVYAPAQGSC